MRKHSCQSVGGGTLLASSDGEMVGMLLLSPTPSEGDSGEQLPSVRHAGCHSWSGGCTVLQ